MPGYKKKAALPPSRWGEWRAVVEGSDLLPEGIDTTSRFLRFVGTSFLGIEPYFLEMTEQGEETPVVLQGTPENPHDKTALLASQEIRRQLWPLGHISRAEKHWLAHLHPDTLSDPGFRLYNHDGSWGVYLRLPTYYTYGYLAFNRGEDVEGRERLPRISERNWWLSGWLSARDYSLAHPV